MAQIGIDEALKLEAVHLTAPIPRNLGVLTVRRPFLASILVPANRSSPSGCET
jgi:hypothetical protein